MNHEARGMAIGFQVETIYLALQELRSSKAWDIAHLNRLKPGLGDRVEAAGAVDDSDRWRTQTSLWNEVLSVLVESEERVHGGDMHSSVLDAVLGRWQRKFGELLTSAALGEQGDLVASLLEEIQERKKHQQAPLPRGTMALLPRAPQGEKSNSPFSNIPTAFLILFVMVIYHSLAQWNSVREGLCDINSRLSPTAGLSEVRKAVRISFCGLPAAHVVIVTRDSVNLRAAPSMKAEVLFQLPRYLAVSVIDDSNRDWLNVYFEKDGYAIEGWVSRKYLKSAR